MERSTAAVSAVRYSVVSLAAACAACSSFSTVRSAVVHPGPSLMIHGSIASPPGDETAWFYAFNCASDCNEVLSGGDIGLSFSHVPEKGTPFTFGLGSNGLYPYAEGYWQIARSERRPFGVGARLGLSVWSWTQHQVYARFNRPSDEGSTFLWNPGIIYHTGNSPNGENRGSFLGLVQSFGWEFTGDGPALLPSLSVVFGTFGLSVIFQRNQ